MVGYRLVSRFGEPAPGPVPVLVAPAPDVFADLGSHEYHRVGIERKRASIVQRVTRETRRIEPLTHVPTDVA